jgi:hypothetical protein
MQIFILIVVALLLTACEKIAVLSTPKKQPIPSHSELATQAEKNFWTTLHKGDYKNIDEANRLLMAAYLQNPNDPKLAAHIGFLHIWKITERGREKVIPPTIVDQIVLSKKYFKDAVELDPADARYLGFYGDSQLVMGKIFNDQRLQTRGYFTLKRAIQAWPQFNYFSAGYVMSPLPIQDKHFKEGLEWQWQTLNVCAQTSVSRENPDFSPYMKLETQSGPGRACWDSWIAPHNFEGFFMNMGDMLVKSGDWQTGVKIYRNAQLAKNYSDWPYRWLLEDRIAHAQDNVKNFQHDNIGDAKKAILFNSGYGCAACHQS